MKKIILEIYRELYLEPGSNTRNVYYDKVKKTITEYLETIVSLNF